MAFIKPSKILDPNNTANRTLATSPGNRLTLPALDPRGTAPSPDGSFDPLRQVGPPPIVEDGDRIVETDGVTGGKGPITGKDPEIFTTGVSSGRESGVPAPNLTEDFDLGEFIANALKGGSAFNSETFNAGLEQLQNREARAFELRGAGIEADVASRGLSASTIPTGFIEQSKDRRADRLQSGEADLGFKRAEAEDEFLNNTLNQANIFLDSQNRTESQRRRDDILLLELRQAKDEAERDRAFEKWRTQETN